MTNINAEEIRKLEIPALDKSTQIEVVKAWKSAIRRRDETLKSVRGILASIDDVLLSELGVTARLPTRTSIKERVFKVAFERIVGQRLDPIYHQSDIFSFVRQAKSALIKLGALGVYFATGFAAGRSEQSAEDDGIIQIRPTNLSNDHELIFQRNITIAPSELAARKADILTPGEVLFNNTNSQEQVGKTVYFDLEGTFFCSNHITRIGTRSDRLNAQYLAYVLSLYHRQRVFYKLCTNWNNQSGVGTDVLEQVLIPLPPPERQAEIVERLNGIRHKARALRLRAADELKHAKLEIEDLILGK